MADSAKKILSANQQVEVPKKKGGGELYFSGVSPVDVALAIRHLSIMLESGLSLEAAIKVLAEQADDSRLAKAFIGLLESIQSGQTLAEGMKKYPKVFSSISVSIVNIGEQGGTLEKNLDYLADFLKNQYELQRKVKGALVYPLIVLALTVVEMLGVIFFILPKLDSLFSTFDDIPPFTKFVMDASRVIRENSVLAGGSVVAFGVVFGSFMKTKTGKNLRNKAMLNAPVVKKLYKSQLLATFSRTLGILLESGIPISKSLSIAAETINDETYMNALVRVQQQVQAGNTLAASLSEYSKLFPATFVKIVEVGEATGSLEESLDHMYEYYNEEVNDMANNLTTLLEPLLLIFIGAMIGILAVLIIAPIYQLTGTLNS
ncbi:MAG: type II secretion system F family protein [Candidatus Dojkabacteria bacterium]